MQTIDTERKETGPQTALKTPAIGDRVTVRGHLCRIFKIHPCNTFDVESLDSDHAWRVSGIIGLQPVNP